MSIEAKDLRLGNIFWENYGGYVIVTAIGCNKVGDAPNTVSAKAAINGNLSGSFDCASIEPVPLSPELLLKCGFVIHENQNDLYKKVLYDCLGARIYILITDFSFSLADSDRQHNDGHEIAGRVLPYLHQLQNLYHSLTGKELKIEL